MKKVLVRKKFTNLKSVFDWYFVLQNINIVRHHLSYLICYIIHCAREYWLIVRLFRERQEGRKNLKRVNRVFFFLNKNLYFSYFDKEFRGIVFEYGVYIRNWNLYYLFKINIFFWMKRYLQVQLIVLVIQIAF